MKISEKNEIYYLDEGKIEFYTPYKYLETINKIDGNKIDVFGLMPYKFYSKITDTKPTKVGIFNNPSIITMYPLDIKFKVTDRIWDGIYDYSNENEYTVLCFEKGSRLMNKNIINNLNNVTLFMESLVGCKIDNNIPYNMLSKCWIKNLIMNNESLNVPYTILNLVIYELCRSVSDTSKPFGQLFGKNPKMSPVAYKFIGIRQLCAANSVYSALSFEDMNSMLDSSLNMTQKEKDQKISPVEQVIKF